MALNSSALAFCCCCLKYPLPVSFSLRLSSSVRKYTKKAKQFLLRDEVKVLI